VLAVAASAAAACARADEPRAPAPAASGVGLGSRDADLGAVDGGSDAEGALRALPMPQHFPRFVWDAAGADASRDAGLELPRRGR
jgi:hypothetical protein